MKRFWAAALALLAVGAGVALYSRPAPAVGQETVENFLATLYTGDVDRYAAALEAGVVPEDTAAWEVSDAEELGLYYDLYAAYFPADVGATDLLVPYRRLLTAADRLCYRWGCTVTPAEIELVLESDTGGLSRYRYTAAVRVQKGECQSDYSFSGTVSVYQSGEHRGLIQHFHPEDVSTLDLLAETFDPPGGSQNGQ